MKIKAAEYSFTFPFILRDAIQEDYDPRDLFDPHNVQ